MSGMIEVDCVEFCGLLLQQLREPKKNWKGQTTLKRKQKHNNNEIMYFPASVVYSRGTTLSHLILSDDITYYSSRRTGERHLTLFELVPFTKRFS